MARHFDIWKLLASSFAVVFLLSGCRFDKAAAPVTAVTSPIVSISAVTPTLSPPAQTPQPTAAKTASSTPSLPASPAPKPAETFTPEPADDLLSPYTITGMRAREYPGGEINVREPLESNENFSRFTIDYPSDGLTITGSMTVPAGDGPFPVVILLHGYFERDQYWSGAGTWQAAEFFARNGYLAIAPDFRSWGGSDTGYSFFHMGLVADTINLISSLPSLPQVDADRIALWGHSMGGGIATKVLTIDDRAAAAVLYAPNSGDDADLINRWGPGCLPGQSEKAGDKCNPAEVIPQDLPAGLVEAYLRAADDPGFLRQVAPIYQLETVNVPLQIHIGTADGAALAQTPPEWSLKLYEALRSAGKEAVYFPYPNEGHFFQPAAWGQLLDRALALFDEQLRS